MTMDASFILFGPLLTLLLLVPLIVVLNVFLVRWTWRAATQDMPGTEFPAAAKVPPGKEPPPFRAQSTGGMSVLVIVLIVCALGAIPVLLCAGVLTYFVMPSRSVPAREPAIVEEYGSHVREPTPIRGPGDGVP